MNISLQEVYKSAEIAFAEFFKAGFIEVGGADVLHGPLLTGLLFDELEELVLGGREAGDEKVLVGRLFGVGEDGSYGTADERERGDGVRFVAGIDDVKGFVGFVEAETGEF